ncbi:NAD(P)-dependent oxidoreductase [Polaromonas sp. SM01]|uniref:NAD-dependent epimerase/dehydratase family protein n=1 Tax=Polaromonas sp. SM01 TaxID=3085630 RepID=UPI002981657A|nr:NAD(P)-dependent oxidoreductase [Polaromonas sp. SM01]MDW5443944.1 NAD(P)-dependent oxidoreductase [Polaromonas sp. SM01]
MRIALTGASGNFGREFLARADGDVIAINRGDWGNIDQLLSRGVDVVIHAASDLQSSMARSPTKLLDSNVVTTARLLEAMKAHEIPRLIFMSSCAVYGDSIRSQESSACHPASINGISKLLNEKIISEFCEANLIQYEILRVFNMYGGTDHFSILSHIRKALKNGSPFTLNNAGIAQRDFIHVADVAAIVHQLLKFNVPHTTLNVGTGVATKVSTLVDLIRARHPELVIQPNSVREAEYSRADMSRLKALFGYKFIQIEDYLASSFERDPF